jgi:hypothetical protein
LQAHRESTDADRVNRAAQTESAKRDRKRAKRAGVPRPIGPKTRAYLEQRYGAAEAARIISAAAARAIAERVKKA